jgi:LemA protein
VTWVIVLVVLIVVIAIGAVASYNRFVSQRNMIKDAWANIDTELRRRYDLIPNLVSTVQGYATHEREVFENVTKARAMATAATGSPAEQAAAEGPFVAALRQLLAVAENYPQLKANENFLALQAELSNTEDRLQTARRFYNGNVREYNRRVQSFPSMIVANFGHFELEEFFEVDEALRGEAGVPKVDFSSLSNPTPPAAAGSSEPTPPAPPAGGSGQTPPPPPTSS